MADLISIARPYALAAFDYAREKQQLQSWKTFLNTAAEISKNAEVIQFLSNPQVRSDQAYQFYEGVLTAILSHEQKNFLLLLAQNKRLATLPEIAALY